MKFLILLLLTISLSSCKVDTIIDSYEKRWNQNLTGFLPSLNLGRYSSLSQIDKESFLVIREILTNDGSSDIAVYNIDLSGNVFNTKSSILEDQNIDIRQFGRDSNIHFHGQSPSNPSTHSFLSISSDLELTSSNIDLSTSLNSITPSSNFISSKHLYISGENSGKPGHSIIKLNRKGETQWRFELDEAPLDYFEGKNEELFILLDKSDGISLLAIESDGELNWITPLDGSISEIVSLKSAEAIFGSSNNTISVLGTDQTDNTVIIFIDSRGRFIFQRFYSAISPGQVQDFMVTGDGAFMMLITDIDSPDGSSFSVLKLNHRAVETWRGDFKVTEAPGSIEFLELINQDVVILTSTGDLFLIEAS